MFILASPSVPIRSEQEREAFLCKFHKQDIPYSKHQFFHHKALPIRFRENDNTWIECK